MQWSVLATDKNRRGVNLRFGGAVDDRRRAFRPGPDRARTNGPIGSDALSDRLAADTRTRCMPSARCWTKTAAVFPGASIRPSIGSSFTTWRARGTTGRTNTPRPSWRKRRPRAWPTVARRCISIPAGTTISPRSSGAKNGSGRGKRLSSEMQSQYGLKVSLHTPLASWMSVGWPMGGNSAPATYPRRRAPQGAARSPAPSDSRCRPATMAGEIWLFCRGAKANASSVFADGAMPIHQIAHLNDGWYGNQASWIAKTPAAWAEIDLGDVYTISRVRLVERRDQAVFRPQAGELSHSCRPRSTTPTRRRPPGSRWRRFPASRCWACGISPSLACEPAGSACRSSRANRTSRGWTRSRFLRTARWPQRTLAAWESQARRGLNSPMRCSGASDDLPGLEGLPGRSGQAAVGELRRRRGLS